MANNTKGHQNPSISDAKGDPTLSPEETTLYQYLRNTMATIIKKYTNEKLKEYIETKLSPEVRLDIPQITISYVKKTTVNPGYHKGNRT